MQEASLEKFKRRRIGDAEYTNIERIELETLLGELIEDLQSFVVKDFAINLSAGMVARANQQNKRTIESSVKQALGIDVKHLLSDKVVQETLNLAVVENVNLITSIKTRFINDVGDVVRDSIHAGRRHTDIISLIRDRGNVSQSRARLIARDQTAKINSDLTRERHQSLGITMYEWGGAGDERERESHCAMNGKICRYDDPTVYSGDDGKTWQPRTQDMVKLHPGQDFQCRCFQIPYVKLDAAE